MPSYVAFDVMRGPSGTVQQVVESEGSLRGDIRPGDPELAVVCTDPAREGNSMKNHKRDSDTPENRCT